ncbi:TetM/TetW/TetO/TetS family tetracycline resistance ribosomal protection protein, partial [Streptococcus suis]
MKIINLGILAHVDAGKTTLTESLLYTSGAIAELGSVDEGTTRTDTMNLERQRGITIQTAVTSFQWEDVKVNIIDTPGHMDFLAEVYRSLAVLDGAILVISAKDGVQAQTRILFHALRKMNIPTVIFINKIDQAGVDLQSVVQSVRDKLSADIIIKQTVSLSPEIVLEENTDIEAWDAVIENNDKLLEKYIAGEPISREKLVREEQRRVQDASLFPVYYGSAKKGLGIQPLMDAVTGLFQPIGEQGSAALCGSVFKVEYTDCGQRRVYLRLYSGTLRLRDTVALAGREKLKITEMRIPSKGEIVRTDTAYPGEIVILADDTLKLNDILGNEKLLPHKTRIDNPMPLLRTTVEPQKPEQREALLNALAEIADTDPLLHFDIDTVTHEIMLSFLGKVQLEVICSLLEEKYHVGVAMKEPSVIYLERPLRKAEYTIHIEVPPNPFWASVGLSIEPLPIGSGVQYESRVSLGYLNQSFQNAVMEGVLYGCEQGLYGWKVTDCKICFEYGLYYSPVSTPADFRLLSPIVLEQALKKAGTELLEPYLHFEIYAPQEYLSRAYHDAPRYCADIVSTQIKNDEVILKGEIPARCIQEYRNDLTNFTNGQG